MTASRLTPDLLRDLDTYIELVERRDRCAAELRLTLDAVEALRKANPFLANVSRAVRHSNRAGSGEEAYLVVLPGRPEMLMREGSPPAFALVGPKDKVELNQLDLTYGRGNTTTRTYQKDLVRIFVWTNEKPQTLVMGGAVFTPVAIQ